MAAKIRHDLDKRAHSQAIAEIERALQRNAHQSQLGQNELDKVDRVLDLAESLENPATSSAENPHESSWKDMENLCALDRDERQSEGDDGSLEDVPGLLDDLDSSLALQQLRSDPDIIN